MEPEEVSAVPTITPDGRRLRAQLGTVAAQARKGRASAEDVAKARREYAAQALADHIARVVSEAPPLTNEQRERLALLLRGADRGAAA